MEMGKYADVIGRDPKIVSKPLVGPLPLFEPLSGFKVALAEGTRWVTAGDLDPTRRAARERFGSTIVLFDYNGDGSTGHLPDFGGCRERKGARPALAERRERHVHGRDRRGRARDSTS